MKIVNLGILISCTLLISTLSACSLGNAEAIESKKDVAVRLTLDEDNVLNLSGPLTSIVKNVTAMDGRVADTDRCRFIEIDSQGNLAWGQGNITSTDMETDIYISPRSNSSMYPEEAVWSNEYRLDYISDRITYLSILPEWDGDLEDIDDYLTDENSVEFFRNEKAVGRVAVFKNGKIVEVKVLSEKYADELSRIGEYNNSIKAKHLNIYGYLVNVKGVNQKTAALDASGLMGLDSFLYQLSGVYTSDQTDQIPDFVVDKERDALSLAMIDWGKQYRKGKIDNYGYLVWTPDNSNLILSISFPKTDVIKIAKMIRGE